MTREQGHGAVTLPADYAHNHVRLGYAATEHGYQSDTVDHSVSALDRHDSRVRLRRTLDEVPVLRREVGALELWNRWARGEVINVQQLGDTIAQLTSHSRRDEHTDEFRALGQAALDWAEVAGIDRPTGERHPRTLERAGPGLDL